MLERDGTFQRFNDLLLEMVQQHALYDLLSLVTTSLSSFLDAALVRIWLLRPGDVCDGCRVASSCRDRTQCLHLVASFGRSISDGSVWDKTDGGFRRLGIGMRKVGQIAADGRPLEVAIIDPKEEWIANPQWIRDEQICSMGGHPLVFRGHVIGVLVIFTRSPFDADAFFLLRMVADHLAYAIVNTRAFEEIETLKQQLEMENQYLREEVQGCRDETRILGKSAARNEILDKIHMVASTESSVLIEGESGTGKELVAREIHSLSYRTHFPMIKINCAAIAPELFASQFFGHVKGAFTGAYQSKIGFLRAADGGTLFLDEVAEIPLAQQAVLLRVLQDGEYQRVGDEKSQKVDVRVLSASNQSLSKAVEAGKFRADLYYRLNVFPIYIAPLRGRKEDIMVLAEHFLEVFSQKMNRVSLTFSKKNIEEMNAYDWPGNVRELQNVIERAVITTLPESEGLDLPTFGKDVQTRRQSWTEQQRSKILSDEDIRRLERSNMIAALEHRNWKIYGPHGAAEELGLKPTTMISRMKKYGIKKPKE